jgi:uncharacterized membrane protein
MEGVREVKQLDDKRLHWKAQIGGQEREWDAEIYDQIPDQRIAWRSIGGTEHGGVVQFDKISNDRTRVRASIQYEPKGVVENVGDMVGIVSQRVQGDLERFKSFIEQRGQETGAWRGEINQGASR